MDDTPRAGHPPDRAERLSIATSYPHGPPDHSFLFVNGRALELVEVSGDPLRDGVVRWGERLCDVATALAALGVGPVPGLEARSAVLAHGSNTSPAGLARKYAGVEGDVVIPVIKAEFSGFDVVYSAHFSRHGSIPSTLVASPGTRAVVALTYLTPPELERMHEFEIAYGTPRTANYLFGVLSGVDVAPRGLAALERVQVYISRHGPLAHQGAPLALAAVAAAGRRHPALAPVALLEYVQPMLAPGEAIESFLLRLIDDDAYRQSRNARLAAAALPFALEAFRETAP